MGELITMPSPRASSTNLPEGSSAAILFFTGVRYCRMETETTPESPRVRRARRRATPVIEPAKTCLAQ